RRVGVAGVDHLAGAVRRARGEQQRRAARARAEARERLPRRPGGLGERLGGDDVPAAGPVEVGQLGGVAGAAGGGGGGPRGGAGVLKAAVALTAGRNMALPRMPLRAGWAPLPIPVALPRVTVGTIEWLFANSVPSRLIR